MLHLDRTVLDLLEDEVTGLVVSGHSPKVTSSEVWETCWMIIGSKGLRSGSAILETTGDLSGSGLGATIQCGTDAIGLLQHLV